MSKEGLRDAQAAFGFERLGPLVACFLHDLDGVLERLVAQRGGQALFIGESLLIRSALDVYRAARQCEPRPREANFPVSRLFLAMGAWRRAPDRALAVLDEALGAGTAIDFAERLGVTPPTAPAPSPTYPRFSAFLADVGPVQALCREHLDVQSARFERYAGGLVEGAPLSVLVGAGWRGEALSLTSQALPQHEFWGVAFGGAAAGVDSAVRSRFIPLMFDGAFDPHHPLSSLSYCPDLLEALFQPADAEIRRLDEVDGAIAPVWADGSASDALTPRREPLFGGVLGYLREVAAVQSYGELVARKEEAAARLADDILFPSRETAHLIGSLSTSLVPPEGERDPETRIRKARWTQGQLALECRPAIARERQRALLPGPVASRHDDNEPRLWDPAAPKVAIVMRTKDRLIFLQRALASVAWQSFDDYVLVIFSDGGDIDGLEAEIAGSRLDRRKVILLDGVQNRGMEAASNAAIRHLNSEYVVIHDDDDSWSADFLARTVAFLDANPAAAGVVTHTNHVEEAISGDRVVPRRAVPFNDWMQSVQIGELLAGNMFPPISFLFRRSVYDQVGGFNESLPVLGDWEFNLRVAALGEIAVIPERLANYHYREASDGGAYANTVIGGVDLHLRYNAIVRRSLLENEDLRTLAAAAAVAPMVSDVRRLVRRSAGSDAASSMTAAADDRWCMLEYAKARPDQLPKLDVRAALDHAKRNGVATPPDFDEAAYLSENPDVARMVASGGCRSGYVHYVVNGRAEGRRRPVAGAQAGNGGRRGS